MKPSAEDLLGYLLGALEPEEHRRVDRILAEQPELQLELLEVRQKLAPLARLEELEVLARDAGYRAAGDSADSGFPPAGLARRVCEFVAREARTASDKGNSAAPLADKSAAPLAEEFSNSTENLSPENQVDVIGSEVVGATGDLQTGARQAVIMPSLVSGLDRTEKPARGMSVSRELSLGNSWQIQDFIVLAAVLMLASAILMPALLASRNQARLAACQDNLRRVGMALFNYAEANQRSFVPIARTGPLDVAGAYAPVLKAGQYIESDHVIYCTAAVQDGLSDVRDIPTLDLLQKAFRENSQQLAELQSLMGGSYGYTLGHYEKDQYVGPMNLGRSFRVIMSDTPSSALANRNSANHGGIGLNMLFEDGGVRFSSTASVGSAGESIFVNRNGLVAAGTDVHDSVIGASNVSAWISNTLYRQ